MTATRRRSNTASPTASTCSTPIPDVHGIILQLPLPDGVDPDGLLERIDPLKDVDGLHPANQGRILQGRERFLPATPHGVQQLLVRSGNDPGGRHVVIVGRSRLVGMPLAAMLAQKRTGANATVTICHTNTTDLAAQTRRADILVAATGRAATITADMVREGAVVIDVGVNRVDDPSRKRGLPPGRRRRLRRRGGEGVVHHAGAGRGGTDDGGDAAQQRHPRRPHGASGRSPRHHLTV